MKLGLDLEDGLILLGVASQLRVAIVVDESPFLLGIFSQIVFAKRPIPPFDERSGVLQVAVDRLDRLANAVLLLRC